jgi:hypothetical protein
MALTAQQKEKRATKEIRRNQKKKREESEEEDTNWHPIGNVEEVCAHQPEGLRKQLKQWEAEAEEVRHET